MPELNAHNQSEAIPAVSHEIEGAEDAMLQATVIARYFGLDIDLNNIDSEDPNISFNDALSKWTADGKLSRAYRDIVIRLKLTDSDLNDYNIRNEIVENITNEIRKLYPPNTIH